MAPSLKSFVRRIASRASRRDIAARMLLGGLGGLVNRPGSMFVRTHRPDYDYDFGGFPDFGRYRRDWIHGNAPNNLGDLTRLYLLVQNARLILEEGIAGEFAELGVYKGNSAKILADIAQADSRSIWLFDTFSGFDPAETKQLSAHVAAAFSDTGLDAVRAFLQAPNARFVQGRFPASVANVDIPDRFALVHIDCDLYEPMLAGLQFFYPRMQPGGLFVLHDYGSGHWPGIRAAIREFLADKPERLVLMPDKSGTAVFRKS